MSNRVKTMLTSFATTVIVTATAATMPDAANGQNAHPTGVTVSPSPVRPGPAFTRPQMTRHRYGVFIPRNNCIASAHVKCSPVPVR